MADSGWVSLRLGDVCTKIGSGATPRGGKEVYLQQGPYALIRSQNVYNDQFRRDGLAFISEEQANRLNNVKVFVDDILLNITGDSVARVCQVASHVLPARVNQHVALIRPDPKKLVPRFLRYTLVCPNTQATLLSWAGSGGTRNALTKGMIESLNLQVPAEVNEQCAIAHILSTLDDKIELNQHMGKTLEAMARTLFKSWFVDFAPVRAKLEGRDTGLPQHLADLFPDRLVDSEFGEIPEGWKLFCLEELADHHTKSITPSSYPELEFEHFSIPAYDAGQMPVIQSGIAIKSNKTVAPIDAILLSKLNPETPRVWLPDVSRIGVQICSTEFLPFTPRCPANRSLLFSLFTNANFREVLKSMVTGTSKSHQRVPPKALKRRKVLSGTFDLFDRFGELTEPMLAHIVAKRAESHTLATLRDSLLPKLISGDIRLHHFEKTGKV